MNARPPGVACGGAERGPEPPADTALDWRRRLIEATTHWSRAALVPEIELRLASDPTGIFETFATVRQPGHELHPPYWAFAWPGGLATARHLLDHPALVAGRVVIDIGAGSGVAAIAAARAGAARVTAVDVDPVAEAAIALNANANGVGLATSTRDILGDDLEADVILVSDLAYEPELRARVGAMISAVATRGGVALIGDRTSARHLPIDAARGRRGDGAVALTLIAEYDAALTPSLPAHTSDRARLWQASRRQTERRTTP